MAEFADYRWLGENEAADLLTELSGIEVTPRLVEGLRRVTTPDRAALLIEQAEMRQRASAKYARAAAMLFTRKGYEQATDQWIAAYKAERFSKLAAVNDLCSGIGGDLIALSMAAGQVTGIDRDPVMNCFAKHNAAVHGCDPNLQAVEAGVDAVDDCEAWHADPDRRHAGRRTSQPEVHEPSLDQLEAWRERCPSAAIKLAPAARLPEPWQDACELEWVSRGGECRQQIAWSGCLTQSAGLRRATRLSVGPQDSTGEAFTLAGDPSLAPRRTDEVGPYVYEPDPSVLAAGLAGALARRYDAAAFTERAAYLTGMGAIEDPLLACFEVLEVMPLNRRKLAGWLSERKVGRLEIKCRGLEIRPERLRQELKPKGSAEMTLLLCPAPSADRVRPIVIAARRGAALPR